MAWHGMAALLRLVPFLRRTRSRKKARPDLIAARLVALRERERRDEQLYFLHAVRRFLQVSPELRSHIYVLSLSDFRETVAEKWARLGDKVGLLTRSIIHKHVDRLALFCQADDETFIMALPTLSRDEAHRRVARIAAELTTSLLGEQVVFGQRPVALTANVSFDALARPDGQFDLPALRRVVDEARSLISVPDDPKLALAALMEGVQHLSIRPLHLDGDGMAAPGAPPSAMGLAGDDGDTVIAPPKGHWVQMATSQRKAAREWQCFRAGSETRDPGFATEVGPDLSGEARVSVVWRPTWIDTRQGVAAYQARVLRVDAEGMLPREGVAAYATNSSSSLLAIDRQVVAATVNVLRSRELGPIGLVLPICWNSLLLDRWSLIGPIADLPTAVRRDNLRIELIHLPGSVAADELKDALAFLHGIGSETLVRLRPSAAPIGMMAAAKAKMIGLDLGELSQDEQMGDEDMLANLDRFRQMAARRGLGSYLWSVRRRRLLVGAILCGYNMANGPGLLKDLGQPAAFIPASRTDLAAAV